MRPKDAGHRLPLLAAIRHALNCVNRLAGDRRLYLRQRMFLQVLTLWQRNGPADGRAAKKLFEQVNAADLEGKATAQERLKTLS